MFEKLHKWLNQLEAWLNRKRSPSGHRTITITLTEELYQRLLRLQQKSELDLRRVLVRSLSTFEDLTDSAVEGKKVIIRSVGGEEEEYHLY